MGILDKLIEKKNVLSYIENRVEQLKEERGRAMDEAEPENREFIMQRFKGRIMELKETKEIANNKEFRKKSKKIQKESPGEGSPLKALRGL